MPKSVRLLEILYLHGLKACDQLFHGFLRLALGARFPFKSAFLTIIVSLFHPFSRPVERTFQGNVKYKPK